MKYVLYQMPEVETAISGWHQNSPGHKKFPTHQNWAMPRLDGLSMANNRTELFNYKSKWQFVRKKSTVEKKKNDLCDSHHKGKTITLSVQMLQQVPPEEGNLLSFLIPQQSLCLLRSGVKHFFPSPPYGSSDTVLPFFSTGSMGVYIPLKIVSVCKKNGF